MNITTVIKCNGLAQYLDDLRQSYKEVALPEELKVEINEYLSSQLSVDVDDVFETSDTDNTSEQAFGLDYSSNKLSDAFEITFLTLSRALQRSRHPYVLPLIHITLAFFLSFSSHHDTALLLRDAPWKEICCCLNKWADDSAVGMREQDFPTTRPLPEDFLIRGLPFGRGYYPQNWFDKAPVHDERDIENSEVAEARVERVLWLGQRLAVVRLICIDIRQSLTDGWKAYKWMCFDCDMQRFIWVQ